MSHRYARAAVVVDAHTNLILVKRAVELTSESLVIIVPDASVVKGLSKLNSALSTLYYLSSGTAFALGRPLMDICVIVPQFAGYDSLLRFAKTCDAVYSPENGHVTRQFQDFDRIFHEVPVVTCQMTGEVLNWPKDVKEANGQLPRYANVVIGGTFDHLHAGHKILLTVAAAIATRRLVVGVTDDSMVAKKQFADFIDPVAVRCQAVKEFLAVVREDVVFEVVPISDMFGPSGSDPDLQCIVVSYETLAGASAVNKKREENGLNQLEVQVIDMVSATKEPFQTGEMKAKISSTDIREFLAKSRQKSS